MLEAKATLTMLFYALGIPVTFLGIVENYGTWKATVLFVLSAAILLTRLVFYIIDKNQTRQHRDMQLEKERFVLDKMKDEDDKSTNTKK